MGMDPSMEQYQTPPRKRRKVWPWVLIGLAALSLCIGGIALAAASGDDNPPAGVQVTDPGMGNTGAGDKSAPKTTRPATPKAVTVKDGTWSVPDEVKPGTYTATVPESPFDLCGWFVRTAPDPEAVRDFGTGNAGDRMRITIKSTDREFEAQGCGTWTKVK